jgi:hypothetical protein
MRIKSFKPLFEIMIAAVLLFVIHKLYFLLFGPEKDLFYFSIEAIYGYFFIAAMIIVGILMLVRRKNIDSVGFVFLLITSIKIIVSYFLLRQIIIINGENLKSEKLHFFIVFVVFLAVETIETIRILNKKQ